MGLVTKYYERAHKLNKKEPQHRACIRSIFSSIEVTNDSIFYYKQILREVQVHSLWNEKSEKSHPDYDRFRDGLGRLV